MLVEEIVLSACITIFALGLLVVSLLSFKKYKNLKLLFVSIVFLVFLIKGLLLSLSLFYGQFDIVHNSPYSELFDLIILVVLFAATLKR